MRAVVDVLVKIVLPRCEELYISTGAERLRISSVAQGFSPRRKVLVEYRRWLCRQESSRGYFLPGIHRIYREYHASKLQRCYLHRLRAMESPCVVAGGFASAMFLAQASVCAWHTNDIDIFVGDKDIFKRLLHLYKEVLADPLHLQVQTSFWSRARGSDEECEYPHFLKSPRERWHGEYEESRAVPLRERIEDWLQMALIEETITPSMHKVLARVREFVPVEPTPQTYVIQATLRAHCSSAQHDVPQALVPLNIILVTLPHHITSEPAAASFICNGFDITACCTALMVNDDLSFTFLEYHKAFDALLHAELILRPPAFAGETRSVSAQMRRLIKYLQRGFHWPSRQF